MAKSLIQQLLKEAKAFSNYVVTVNDRGEIIKREWNENQYIKIELGNNTGLEMAYIPTGTFLMGTPDGEKIPLVNEEREKPQHMVRIKAFFMSKFLITQEQWFAVANLPKIERDLSTSPSYFKGNNLPVEEVSWYDAVEFCARLSNYTGMNFNLPTEAEWEYSCRAGTTTPFHYGETITTNLGNFYPKRTYARELIGEDRKKTTAVGIFPPNAFGLYDMHGNLWELCMDDWHDNYKGAPNDGSAWIEEEEMFVIMRGGSWALCRTTSRSAFRLQAKRHDKSNKIGFRVKVG